MFLFFYILDQAFFNNWKLYFLFIFFLIFSRRIREKSFNNNFKFRFPKIPNNRQIGPSIAINNESFLILCSSSVNPHLRFRNFVHKDLFDSRDKNQTI